MHWQVYDPGVFMQLALGPHRMCSSSAYSHSSTSLRKMNKRIKKTYIIQITGNTQMQIAIECLASQFRLIHFRRTRCGTSLRVLTQHKWYRGKKKINTDWKIGQKSVGITSFPPFFVFFMSFFLFLFLSLFVCLFLCLFVSFFLSFFLSLSVSIVVPSFLPSFLPSFHRKSTW